MLQKNKHLARLLIPAILLLAAIGAALFFGLRSANHAEDEANNLFTYGLVRVEQDDKWGFCDAEGRIVVPCQYDYAGSFGITGLAPVEKDGKAGYVNTKGELAIPLQYEASRSSLTSELAPVKLNGKWGYIDSKGNLAIPCQYDITSGFTPNGPATVKPDGKSGLVDETGKLLVLDDFELLYDDTAAAWPFLHYDDAVVCKKNGKLGLLNTKGEVILPPVYDSIGKHYIRRTD